MARLADRLFAAGEHAVTWQANGAPSGVYVCRLVVKSGQSAAAEFAERLVLIR